MGGSTVVVGSKPVPSGDAPAVTGHQTGKVVLTHRCTEIVADAALMFEELSRDNGANRVTANVVSPGIATPVAEEPGQRIRAARFEVITEDVAFRHEPSSALRQHDRSLATIEKPKRASRRTLPPTILP